MLEQTDQFLSSFLSAKIPIWFDIVWAMWILVVVLYGLYQAGWALGLWRDSIHDDDRLDWPLDGGSRSGGGLIKERPLTLRPPPPKPQGRREPTARGHR